ncbi:hypothetical protein FRC01_005985 [Tulasnella sp. 417]|nr:hypothetical protein FRC01_005985 [Tulasnella sp. 417]
MDVPACTMEKLCIRAIRLGAECWDQSDPKMKITTPLCLYQAESSVTWINMCLSRWLIVQVNGRRLDFWDLENPSDSPRVIFNNICGVIDGSKLLHGPDSAWSLVVSTRSYHTYALRLQLPSLGLPNDSPHLIITRTSEGYSALLDASDAMWAFGKNRAEQVAMVLQSSSGRSARLATANPDELLNLPGAMQILPTAVAVARTSYLDLYDMSALLSALDLSSICRSKTLRPTQTLAYPANWTANHLHFAPTRPGWMHKTEPNPDDICLIFTEPYFGAWVALVARRERSSDEAESKHRMQIAEEIITTPHPAPTWPYLHATPWPPETTTFERPEGNHELIPTWSTSVEMYFPGKNRPDCFGGAKWFVNEILHIDGPAETVLFTLPHSASFPTFEVIQVGQRLLLIQRDEDTCRYQAKALPVISSLGDLLAHFNAGETFESLSGSTLSVDECPARRYSLWRTMMEPTAWSYF